MKISQTSLSGVLTLTPEIHRDERGAFWETWNRTRMAEAGLPSDWAQDNSSFSRKNVVRGIHYQVTDPQGKLVRVTHGAVLDVVVDLRRSSPSFGEHLVMELTAESAQMLWIPKGFGHAYLCLTEAAGFAYKVTASYSRAGERTILWNDPDLAIPWPIAPECAIVSEKDRNGTRFKDAEMFS